MCAQAVDGATAAPASLAEVRVESLGGVGPRIAERLAAIGVHSVQDVLFHLPLRYQDRTRVTPIGSLRAGEDRLICGRVEQSQVRTGRRRQLVCTLSDGSARLGLRFFHFSQQQARDLARGVRVHCFGEARRGPQGLEMVHPEYRIIGEKAEVPVAPSLTPIYPTTEGINQGTWRRLTDQALRLLTEKYSPQEFLPPGMRDALGLPELTEALCSLHRPPPSMRLRALERGEHPGLKRLVFEELLAHQLSLRLLRKQVERRAAPALVPLNEISPSPGTKLLSEALIEGFPFTLTGAQSKVLHEITADLRKPHPMHRLVQGDVGSGKTAVAAVAAAHCIDSGHQAAIMAPTELLAEQHLDTFRTWFEPLNIEVGWISGKLKAGARREGLAAAGGGAPLIVGTHALFQDDVHYQRLGLVIVDEQHRFGVHQRLSLQQKGAAIGMREQCDDKGDGNARSTGRKKWYPHQLIMTATPTPRTLAMTAYADLDTSVIDELPAGRTPVETAVVPKSRRDEVVHRVATACAHGQQAYWVCTLVEESESLKAQAAEDTASELGGLLPDLNIGLVHGRLKPDEKEQMMERFKVGEIQLLIATTVIEVGVDVPNASLMIIENAERLGLAQLHQLRGRVGRGARKSVCVMMYDGPLSHSARARLDVLRETNDGFRIAERDLEIRGPGEMLGTRQTGQIDFKIADLERDRALLPQVSKAATEMLRKHPREVRPLIKRWLGARTRYARV
ncbi:MAG: ATP-dependent DNA helicase RecG [Gammaproteobacteria bacterium]